MNNRKLIKFSIFIIAIIVLLIHHLYAYIGHFGADDLQYAKISADLLNGDINFDDHFTFRFPIVLLTAIGYLVFGINDFTSALPALLVTISILLILYNILKNYNILAIIIGLSIVLFSKWLLFYSDKLMPDIYVALFILLAIFSYYKYKFNNKDNNIHRYALSFTLALLFGFMSKGTIVLIIPLLIYFLINDLIHKQHLKFWISSFIMGVILLISYFCIINYFTGSFFKRFESISANSYLNLCSYDQQSIKILIKRISYEFYQMMISNSMIFGYIFVLPIIFSSKVKSLFKLETTLSFFTTTSIILLLSSNFMTISFSSYSPMCLDVRHYLYLVPVVAIPSAIIISDFINNKNRSLQIILSLTIFSILSFINKDQQFWVLYLPIGIIFFVYYFIKIKSVTKGIFTILFVLILSSNLFQMISYANEIKYREQLNSLQYFIKNQQEECLVITNKIQKRFGDYYTKYNPNSLVKFVTFEDYNQHDSSINKRFILINWYSRYLSNMQYSDLPLFVKNIINSDKPILENKKVNFAIYKYHDSKPKFQTLFFTNNNFESDIQYWNNPEVFLTDIIKKDGNYSNKLSEYSATFIFPLDSILTSKNLLIRSNLSVYYEDKTMAKIVFTIEDKENVYFWKAKDFNKYIKAYSNWWPVSYEELIDHSIIKKNSTLKVFIWNVGNTSGNIDNFNIEILSTE